MNTQQEITQQTNYNCSASGMSPGELRSTIVRIKHDSSLTETDKNRMIQELMTTKYRKKFNATPTRPQCTSHISFHQPKDGSKRVFGCEHYRRGCQISAPCCDQFFVCRFCHDANSDHKIDRNAIDRVRCMSCGEVQAVGASCVKCGVEFAHYFCEPCRLYNDDPEKSIYHCPYCKMCRHGKGLGLDYFHCHRCNTCLSIELKDNHTCVERTMKSDCPVCKEYLFTSVNPVKVMPCGHCIHVDCYEEYTKSNWVCPICTKSLFNMDVYFNQITAMLENEKMPDEFKDMFSKICCADCESRSIAPYHFIYHQCKPCGSYNTKVIGTLRCT